MTTTGGSIGVSLGGNPKITNVGFNQDSRDRQGITRNTVVGDVQIAKAEGNPINRDLGKANEITKDTHRSTNINVESQTIEYATNPGKLKEDIGKAKKEISDVTTAIKESINDRGDDNRNFFGQLRARRQDITMNNISYTAISNIKDKFDKGQISEKEFQEGLKYIAENTGEDLGVATEIFYTDTENMPNDAKDRRAVVKKDETGKYQIYIDMNQIDSTSNLIGTVFEEISHSIDEKAGRQQEMTQKQKDRGEYGLESLGRPTNDYFKEQYKDNGKKFISKGDGINYSNVVGETIGNDIQIKNFENDKEYKEQIKELVGKRFLLYFKDNFRNSKGKFYEEIGYGHKLQTTGITPSNLDITYRTGSIISKTIIKVSKNRDNSITIVLIRHHKLYDEFSKPFDLKNGFPDKRELGNKYNLLTNYKNPEIYRGRFKNKDKDIMLKEIRSSINMRIKEAKERIGGKK